MKLITHEEAIARYGAIENGKWKDWPKWCVKIAVQSQVGLHMINSATGEPTENVYCNSDMAPALIRAFNNIEDRDLAHELDSFDGCFCVRDVRAEPGKPSWHSYALAIDINAKANRLGVTPTMSAELVKCFTDAGFLWGGNFHRLDGMHFQLAQG